MNKKDNYLYSKKGKKQFNKLSNEDKVAVAQVAIADAVNNAMRKDITDAMTNGMLFQMESLYNRFVRKADQMTLDSDEWLAMVDNLMSDIRIGHLKYEQWWAERGKENSNGAGEEESTETAADIW